MSESPSGCETEPAVFTSTPFKTCGRKKTNPKLALAKWKRTELLGGGKIHIFTLLKGVRH